MRGTIAPFERSVSRVGSNLSTALRRGKDNTTPK